MRRVLILIGLVVGALAVSAALLLSVPSGARAEEGVPFPGIRPGMFSLYLNGSQDHREGAKLVFHTENGQIHALNFYTDRAPSGVNVTNRFSYTVVGNYVKVSLAVGCLPGWYGNEEGQCVSPQSVSRAVCQIEMGCEALARSGTYTLTMVNDQDIDLDSIGINDQLDFVIFRLDAPLPTEQPIPTITPIFATIVPQPTSTPIRPTFARVYATSANVFHFDTVVNMERPVTISVTLEDGSKTSVEVISDTFTLPNLWGSFRTGAGLVELLPNRWSTTDGLTVFRTYKAYGAALQTGPETNPTPIPLPTEPPPSG